MNTYEPKLLVGGCIHSDIRGRVLLFMFCSQVLGYRVLDIPYHFLGTKATRALDVHTAIYIYIYTYT